MSLIQQVSGHHPARLHRARAPRALAAVLIAGLGSMALAGCVASGPDPVASPVPAPAPTSAEPQAAPAGPVARSGARLTTPAMDDWRDRPATPGSWFYTRAAAETVASFGTSPAASDTLLVVVCRLPQRQVGIGYVGEAIGQVDLHIRTETADRTLTAGPAEGRAPLVLAELAVFDPLLDAMAFSRGHFVVEVAGLTPLFPPSWPEITRVIEDCRD